MLAIIISVVCLAGQVAFSVAGSCGSTPIRPNLGGFIVGGTEARPHSLPWQIRLGAQDDKYMWTMCGGSIVSDRWVITAAHCIDLDNMGNKHFIYVGAHNMRSKDGYFKQIGVKRIIVHPNWNPDRVSDGNDIALLELDETISFNKAVQPICLPLAGSSYSSGMKFVVSGWGTLSEGGRSADKLMQLVVPHITQSPCKSVLHMRSMPGQLCAGYLEGGKDSCQGDSGGPLAGKVGGRWTLVGVVSYGFGCARKGAPGVYTDVSQYRSFIDKYVR